MAAAKAAAGVGVAAANETAAGLFLVPKRPYDGLPKTMRITMTSSPIAAIALCVVLASPAFADTYAAVSNTAMSITGDIELDETGITFENGEQLTFDEQVADRLTVDGQPVEAHVFRLAQARDPVQHGLARDIDRRLIRGAGDHIRKALRPLLGQQQGAHPAA